MKAARISPRPRTFWRPEMLSTALAQLPPRSCRFSFLSYPDRAKAPRSPEAWPPVRGAALLAAAMVPSSSSIAPNLPYQNRSSASRYELQGGQNPGQVYLALTPASAAALPAREPTQEERSSPCACSYSYPAKLTALTTAAAVRSLSQPPVLPVRNFPRATTPGWPAAARSLDLPSPFCASSLPVL